ncbi:ComF family protein [Curvibacter sp. APW13]|uniref:ComF family protein n=1 Tax=Curvibacter sp. APW13 TaxID=3077236 RepID=UPI0028DF6775|nr:ComF family protein [Curvibacter sp. APW13]MDT8989663.1 ComF family protein [Curvibacter sp. APW13]
MPPGLFTGLLRRIPSQCAVCRRWPATPVCEQCVQAFAQPQSRCTTCALPVPSGVERCGSCLRTPPPLDHCLAALPYAFPWARLIADFKFHAQTALAPSFATLLRSTPWVEPELEACDAVLPIPLGAQRLRERGYNQAAELARALEPRKLQTQWLLRTRDTPEQHQLARSERLKALKGAFALDPLHAPRLQGARVVLIDDVMTTGSTLFEAAGVLRQHGVAHITALALARADALD